VRIETELYSGEYLLPIDARLATVQLSAESAISVDEFSTAPQATSTCKVVVILDYYEAGSIRIIKNGRYYIQAKLI
jgi:hypothetical protein